MTHGRSRTKTYQVWATMIQRCGNPQSRSFADYGGRGVMVCDHWKAFAAFFEDMGEAKGLTLERVDNTKGYSKENCKWATRQEQSENKRNNIFIAHGGHMATIEAMAKCYGHNGSLVRKRIARGWSVQKSLETPLKLK